MRDRPVPTPTIRHPRAASRPLRQPVLLAAALLALSLLLPGLAAAALPPGGNMLPPAPFRPKEFTFFYAQGLFHCIYMRTDTTVPIDSTERDFGHAVSVDLHYWTQLDPILPARPDHWDNAHMWSPSVIESNGTWYLYYTGVTRVPYAWTWYQRIGVATSTDLVNWTRYDEPVFGGNQVPWAFADSSTFDGCQFRDAYVMPDPADPSHWLMYYVTEAAAARGQLIGGVARNAGGLAPWADLMPLWCTDNAHFYGWSESPCLIQHAGTWIMMSTTSSGHCLRYFTTTDPTSADTTAWHGPYRLYDMVNQEPLTDPWFGPEFLSVPGHDYLAVMDSGIDQLGFYEIAWGATPGTFSLGNPGVAGVPGAAAGSPPGLRLVGRASRAAGAMLSATLGAAATARVELFDVAGRHVRTLHSGTLPAGPSVVHWDGRDAAGQPAAHGVYFARLATASGRWTARIAIAD